jgi:hypothetical protein
LCAACESPAKFIATSFADLLLTLTYLGSSNKKSNSCFEINPFNLNPKSYRIILIQKVHQFLPIFGFKIFQLFVVFKLSLEKVGQITLSYLTALLPGFNIALKRLIKTQPDLLPILQSRRDLLDQISEIMGHFVVGRREQNHLEDLHACRVEKLDRVVQTAAIYNEHLTFPRAEN